MVGRGVPPCEANSMHHQETEAASPEKVTFKDTKEPAPEFTSGLLRNSFQLNLRSKHIWTPDKRCRSKLVYCICPQSLHFQENLRTASTPTHQKARNKSGERNLTSTNLKRRMDGSNTSSGIFNPSAPISASSGVKVLGPGSLRSCSSPAQLPPHRNGSKVMEKLSKCVLCFKFPDSGPTSAAAQPWLVQRIYLEAQNKTKKKTKNQTWIPKPHPSQFNQNLTQGGGTQAPQVLKLPRKAEILISHWTHLCITWVPLKTTDMVHRKA